MICGWKVKETRSRRKKRPVKKEEKEEYHIKSVTESGRKLRDY